MSATEKCPVCKTPGHTEGKTTRYFVSHLPELLAAAEAKAYRRAAKHARAYWGDNVSDTLLAWAKECEGESDDA